MPDRPNVLLLVSDEHSFRCVGHRDGGEPVHTPTLDGLAGRGTVFETTYCQVPLCTPSRLCTLTGREARGCGAWTNGDVVHPEDETLAERFRDAGYDTALVGKMHLGGDRQFVGFEDRPYGDITGAGGHQPDPVAPGDDRDGFTDRRSRVTRAGVTNLPETMLQEERVVRESVSWVREQASSEDPWLLCASFSRPHFPLTAPHRHVRRYWDMAADEPTDRFTDPPVGREETVEHPLVADLADRSQIDTVSQTERLRARALYFACVDYLDEMLGDLLAALERGGHLADTVVAYTADHGELAGEHGLLWKRPWHEASTRVPWLVQTPAHRDGEADPRAVERPVGLIDLFPTLCGLAGLEHPEDIDGTDLSEAVRTGADPDRGPVVCDYLRGSGDYQREGMEYRMVREGRYKYVSFRDAPELFFDLEADPYETENVAGDATGEDRTALEELRAFVEETMDFEAALEERARDKARKDEQFGLDTPGLTSGNAYLLPDGRVVDADTPVYDPDVATADPAETFGDWPGEDG